MSHALDIPEIAATVVEQLDFNRETLLHWALINRAFAYPCAVKLASNVLLRSQIHVQLFVDKFGRQPEARRWIRHVELEINDRGERRWRVPWIDRALCNVIVTLPYIISLHLSFPAQENITGFSTRTVGKHLNKLVGMSIPSISISHLSDIPPAFFKALKPTTELSLENCRVEWQSDDELAELGQMLVRQLEGPTHPSPISRLKVHGMNNHSLCVLYAHCGDRLHSLKELNIKLVGEVSDLKEVLSMADMYMEDSAQTLEHFHLETPHPALQGGFRFAELPEESRLLGLETLSSLNVFSFSIQATRIVIDRNQCDTEELIWALSIFKGLASHTQITELQLRIRVDGGASGLQENLAALSLQSDIWKAWDRELIRFRALKTVKLILHSPMRGDPQYVIPVLTKIQGYFLILSGIPERFHISYQAL